MTEQDQVPDQSAQRPLSRQMGFTIVLMGLMTIVAPVWILANHTGPIAVALAVTVGTLFATFAVLNWIIVKSPDPGRLGLFISRLQLVLLLVILALGAVALTR